MLLNVAAGDKTGLPFVEAMEAMQGSTPASRSKWLDRAQQGWEADMGGGGEEVMVGELREFNPIDQGRLSKLETGVESSWLPRVDILSYLL